MSQRRTLRILAEAIEGEAQAIRRERGDLCLELAVIEVVGDLMTVVKERSRARRRTEQTGKQENADHFDPHH